METKSHLKKWIVRGLGVAFISASGFFIYQKLKQNQIQSKIQRVPNSNPRILTKASLLLLLDEANKLIHPKILKITRKAREVRQNMDPSSERFSNVVKQNNRRIMACMKSTLEQVIQSLNVSQNEFEQSVEHYQEPLVQSKLFGLRTVREPNAPKLSKEDIGRILDYFVNVLKKMDEMSQIGLLDLEIIFADCEDKVFRKYGIEKADAESQANELASKDKEIEQKLRLYRAQVRQKEGLFQGNLNLSNLQMS
jgi:hypothetical protein